MVSGVDETAPEPKKENVMLGQKPPDIAVCATCPFRKANHGIKHPAGWYKPANLKRLWNGLRTADAPGMTCHSSDPRSNEYGGTKHVPENSVTHECAGALQLIYREFEVLDKLPDIKTYRDSRKSPLTRNGVAHWVWRRLTNSLPGVLPCDNVELPWEQSK